MVRRFLTYSLDHNRPVKVLFSDTMRYKNITVVLLEGETVGYLTAGRKKPLLKKNVVRKRRSVRLARKKNGLKITLPKKK